MKKQLEVFIFIDAMGWEIVRRNHFLENILSCRKSIRMQFGYSCSAIPTILSGKTPSDHGHLSLFNYAPDRSPFRRLGFLKYLLHPQHFWNRGRVRNQLSKLLKRCFGFTGYFQIYRIPFDRIAQMDYCEKKDLFVPGGLDEIENLADVLSRSGLRYHISDWRLPEDENFRIGQNLIEQENTDFLFLYSAGFDAFLHDHVQTPEKVDARLQNYGKWLTRLFESCQAHASSFHFTVFSDHGMTPLSQTFNMQKIIEETGLIFGTDYAACFDSTMMRIYSLKPEAESTIRNAVAAAHAPGHWLTPEEEKEYGIYRADRCFGTSIFLMDPGVQIIPSDMGQKPLSGMHGFLPEDKDSAAALLSNEPVPDGIRTVADYFVLMTRGIQKLKTG